MKAAIADVRNNYRLIVGLERLRERRLSSRIGVLHAPSRYGKTTALASIVASCSYAVYLRFLSTDTPTTFSSRFCRELGGLPKGRAAPNMEFVIQSLATSGKTVLLDECNLIMRKPPLLDLVRDIPDEASVPMLLVGMRDFARHVANIEHLAGRVSEVIEFEPLRPEDTRLVVETVCEVSLTDDLIIELHRRSRGVVGELVMFLSFIEAYANRRGLKRISADDLPAEQIISPVSTIAQRPRLSAAVAA